MSSTIAPQEDLLMRAPAYAHGWEAYVAEIEKDEPAILAAVLERCPATVEVEAIDGIAVRWITPRSLADANDRRCLVHIHGGAYVTGKGVSGIREGVLVAHHSRTRVVSIDYRMPPAHPFPAAVHDVAAVWAALIRRFDASRLGVFGTSTGGALAVCLALKARELGLPLPAALAPATPWSDLSETGDSYQVLRHVDGAVPFYEGLLARAARLYAGDDLRNPLASPVYADLRALPPTILMTGTRDLFLSCTVRLHRAMRAVGVDAELHVYEGISHGELTGLYDSAEALDAFGETVRFFDRHLAK